MQTGSVGDHHDYARHGDDSAVVLRHLFGRHALSTAVADGWQRLGAGVGQGVSCKANATADQADVGQLHDGDIDRRAYGRGGEHQRAAYDVAGVA